MTGVQTCALPIWGADRNAFYAYIVSYIVWYMGEGVLHLLGEAPRVATKMELQPNNGRLR